MIAEKVIMVRPSAFRFNVETAGDNAYQMNDNTLSPKEIQNRADKEFSAVADALKEAGIHVDILDDVGDDTPDSIFPNNIFVTFAGKLFIAPMYSENRRLEFPKLAPQLDQLLDFSSLKVTDFREKNIGVLEGTGSVVIDRRENIAYGCLSKRCDEDAFLAFCRIYDLKPVPFKARQHDRAVYHTNVILSIAEDFALVAEELITENKASVMETLKATKKHVLSLSGEAVDHFCGNCLELMGREKLFVMSEEAYNHFTKEQIRSIERTHKIIHVPMDTIDYFGGGSMRCILAENYC